MRKPPIRHVVHAHRRAGYNVHKYERGHGRQPRQVIGSHSLGSGYTVRLEGPDKHESFTVNAGSYPEAMTMGLSRATFTPKTIRLRRR